MARTTSAAVRKIINVSTTIDVDAFITTANLMVTNILGSTSLDSDTLTEIETWITAHLLCARVKNPLTEKIGDASITTTGSFGMQLKQTEYGQTAIMLDTSNKLRDMDKKPKTVSMKILNPLENYTV